MRRVNEDVWRCVEDGMWLSFWGGIVGQDRKSATPWAGEVATRVQPARCSVLTAGRRDTVVAQDKRMARFERTLDLKAGACPKERVGKVVAISLIP